VFLAEQNRPGGQSVQPRVIVLAGPNGAGKTTAAPRLLRDKSRVRQFVNADTLALGLSGFDAESAALTAGRIMLHRLHELAEERSSFAFETTRQPLVCTVAKVAGCSRIYISSRVLVAAVG
jgi:predicted ABC-type ATPase